MTVQIEVMLAFINDLFAVFLDNVVNQCCEAVSLRAVTNKILLCNGKHFYEKSLPFGKPFLHVSDILRFAAPRRLRKLNIHVHHILAVMTDKPLAHL